MDKWYIDDKRIRKTYKAGDRRLVVYWDVDSCNGIAWDRHRDRIGEPMNTSKFDLLNEDYVLDTGD